MKCWPALFDILLFTSLEKNKLSIVLCHLRICHLLAFKMNFRGGGGEVNVIYNTVLSKKQYKKLSNFVLNILLEPPQTHFKCYNPFSFSKPYKVYSQLYNFYSNLTLNILARIQSVAKWSILQTESHRIHTFVKFPVILSFKKMDN